MNERIDYLSRLYAKHRWSQAQGCQWNLGISFLILSYTHTLLIKISDDRNKYIETWPNQLLLYLYIPSIPQTDFLLALTQTRCLRTQSWVAWQWSWFWYDLDVCYTQLLFFFWGFLPSPAYEAVWYQRMARLCFSAMYVRLAEMGHRHCVADLEEKYGMVNEFKSFLVHCLSKNTCSLKTWWHHLSNRGLFLLLSRSGVPKCFTVSLTFFFFF